MMTDPTHLGYEVSSRLSKSTYPQIRVGFSTPSIEPVWWNLVTDENLARFGRKPSDVVEVSFSERYPGNPYTELGLAGLVHPVIGSGSAIFTEAASLSVRFITRISISTRAITTVSRTGTMSEDSCCMTCGTNHNLSSVPSIISSRSQHTLASCLKLAIRRDMESASCGNHSWVINLQRAGAQ